MSGTSGERGRLLEQALSRRGWYELEARHEAMARGRLAVIAILALAALVAPLDMSAGERAAAVGACVVAAALQFALVWTPRRHPQRMLLAVDVALVIDAALVVVLARASGGTDSRAVWLLPLVCLAATLDLGPLQGVKALVLSALAVGALTLWDPSPSSSLAEAAAPLALAVPVVVIAALLDGMNRQLVRLNERRGPSVTLVGADDADEVRAAAAEAARELLPGWDVDVRLGRGEGAERTWRENGRAWLAVPLVTSDDAGDGPGRTLGAIVGSRPVANRGRTTVRRDAVAALRALAQDTAAALSQVEVREGLERLSMADPLTNLGNRRAFDEALAAEMARAQRSGGSMGVVILDVDHFKQFNDRHGHQAGDDALISVARVLEGEARAEDRACRIGGEEFALLLPGADQQAAAAVAERVRRAVEHCTGTAAPLTVSLGVAAVSRDGDPRDLVATADARLYVAKASGRNRVVAS